jgi:hypothetical protein
MSDEAEDDTAAKPLLSFSQSIRVAMFSVFFALSITMMAQKHGRDRLTSIETQLPFSKETEYRMRKLLSEPSDLDDDEQSSIGMSMKERRPVNDPEVIAVESSLRQYINEGRRLNCASLNVHDEPGIIQFAQRSAGKGGLVRYDLEVTFGNETVFARMSKRKGADKKTSFQMDSLVPAPCEDGIGDQLAVTFAGQSTNKPQRVF